MKIEKTKLFEALYFLKMSELKALCLKLGLPYSEKKGQVIDTIKHFVNTGNVLEIPEIPSISKAKKNQIYPLAPDTKMLLGSYKNDAQTRAFFKKLIGPHFHFTAFGIDWLNERWQAGKPPTYQEFADMWQKEVDNRKNKKPQPKQEWALITFVQKYMEVHPDATKTEVNNAWHKKRMEMVTLVEEYFRK
ncbi:MAG: hypothetical protein AMXMBFR12_10520 [Candidatus Babeliales bacterium]